MNRGRSRKRSIGRSSGRGRGRSRGRDMRRDNSVDDSPNHLRQPSPFSQVKFCDMIQAGYLTARKSSSSSSAYTSSS